MSDSATVNSTRERLLQAALQVFAEHGYEAATIREICGRAEANVAAVHYHFGDKRKLYQAIFGRLFETLRERRTAFLPADAPPEERLRVYIQALFEEIFCCDGDSERQVQLSTIYLSEMANPTEVLDRIVEEHLEPDARELYSIIGDLLGGGADEALIVDCAASVIGQILYYYHAGPIVTRLHPERAPIPERIDALVRQVWRFSLGGITHAARDVAVAGRSEPESTRKMPGVREATDHPSDEMSDQGC